MRMMYIGGGWRGSDSGEAAAVFDPATEEVIDRVVEGTAADVALAVGAAKEAFGVWRWVSGLERAGMLHEAIGLVNDSEYGLGTVCRTTDGRLAKRFFEEVQAGTIWINDPLTDNYGGPFGGMKLSGNARARELGEEGLESFLETKHVHWDFDDRPKDFGYPYGRSVMGI